jgi:hypothetical protein
LDAVHPPELHNAALVPAPNPEIASDSE